MMTSVSAPSACNVQDDYQQLKLEPISTCFTTTASIRF